MINLISPEQKRDIRAARINVALVRYCITLLLLAVLVAIIYGVGYWLVGQEKVAVNQQLAAQADQSKAFSQVEKQADEFRQNLSIAKSILDKETSYSTFLTSLAATVPNGAVLTGLSVGTSTASVKKGLTINARASSYPKVLELKSNLEKSPLFENVSILNITRPDEIGLLTGAEARYPYQVILSVKQSSKAAEISR